MGCTNFDVAFAKIYTCVERNLGGGGAGVKIFWRNPERHILAWFHAFWAIDRANPFTGFRLGEPTKKGHYKKSPKCYISPICGEFPQLNSTKIGLSMGVADVINHTKSGNDRSREYKVT